MRFYWPIAKTDAERRMVWGYASTEAEDSEGETVKREALTAALDDYMRFANIREMHQPSAVGIAEEAAIDERGLYIAAKIVDSDAWAKVLEGVYKGFSIGGRVTARDPANRKIITGLELSEISVVARPANPEAVFDCWKRAAAADPDPVEYADPGYQADGRERYPIDTEAHIRAAWVYIHLPDKERRYTADELQRIRARIVAAWRGRIDPEGPPAAARKSLAVEVKGSPLRQRLQAIIAELCDLLETLAEDDGEFAAMLHRAAGEVLQKREPQVADALAKLVGELVPRLDALQQRVEEIARTPLPPQTIARGFAGIAKRDDGGGPLTATEDIVAALARMSDDERTLTLIKAAHANPIRPAR
jgi:HK97 family phage prohead protease